MQAAGKVEAVRAAVMAADPSDQGYLTNEQLEQGLAAAGLKFTRHQVTISFAALLVTLTATHVHAEQYRIEVEAQLRLLLAGACR